MIEDMTVRNLPSATQRSYIHAVSMFSRFRRSPETLTLEQFPSGVNRGGLNETAPR